MLVEYPLKSLHESSLNPETYNLKKKNNYKFPVLIL